MKGDSKLRSTLAASAAETPKSRLAGGKADFFWTLVSQYGRIALQGAAFVGLTRLLKADGYGLLAGLAGFVAIAAPFGGGGGASLIVKHVSRDRSKIGHWLGGSFVLLAVTAPLLALAVFASASAALGRGFQPGMIWGFFLADVVMMRITDIAALTFQAVDRLDLTAKTNVSSGVLRLLAVAVLLSLLSLRRYFGRSAISMPTQRDVRMGLLEGFPFCLGLASRSIYSDIDKTMLARMTTGGITGIYSAAYRIVNMAVVPAQALIGSIVVRLLRTSQHGFAATLRAALRIYPLLLGYSICVGIALWFCAPFVVVVVGPSYTFIAEVLRALAWMPIIQVTHFLAGETLMAMDRQGPRSTCQVVTALLNVLLNLVLIPGSSWKGAVTASYWSEGFLAVSLAVLLLLTLKSESKDRKPPVLAAPHSKAA